MSRAHAVRQEDDRIRGLLVFAIITGATLFATLCVFVSWILWRGYERAFGGLPEVVRTEVTAPSISQVNQTLINIDTASRRLANLKLHQLEEHAWIDQAAGVAKIPIEEAMRALVAGGGPR
jgi:hypothetical protein